MLKMSDNYWSIENCKKRKEQLDHLDSIRDQITNLQKQHNKLTDEYAENNWDLDTNRYLIYTLVQYIPYGWESEGPTHIDTIAETCEESQKTGWLSSSS